MEVSVGTDDGDLNFMAPTIEVARLVASAHGYHVDVEPGAPGHVKLTATSVKSKATIVVNGTTVNDAAGKLVGKFVMR